LHILDFDTTVVRPEICLSVF